jgi:hypothetical protein
MAKRMTVQLITEIRDAARADINTLQIEKRMASGEDIPNEAERAAISRTQERLRKLAEELSIEIAGLK